MKKFIAYFDYLGFKDFIDNNDIDYQKKIMNILFTTIEGALAKDKHIETTYGIVHDFSKSRINCINFSDTVIFWSNDDSFESLEELLIVAHNFNWKSIDYFFPVRGSIVFDEIEYIDFRKLNEGGLYNINSVFGKGLVNAHLKSENQNWAGTVIDESVVIEILKQGIEPDKYLSSYAIKYKVPYKIEPKNSQEEFVFWITKGIMNEEGFQNRKRDIEENFSAHNKKVDTKSVIEKIGNTIKFLEKFKKDH